MITLRRAVLYIITMCILLVVFGASGAFILRAAEPSSAPSSTERALREAIRESGAEVVAIAVHDLATGRRILINERVSLHAASTMKVPVMMEVFRLVALGQLRLTDQLVVTNRFSSIVDGSDYFLTPESDSDRDIYRQLGRKMTVLSLVERMITISSNLATNILMERVGPGNVRKLTRELGAGEIEVRRGVEDSLAFQAGLNNTTTAFDLMLLLLALAEGRKSPPLDHRRMIRILAAQKFNDAIPAGLPAGTIVAHKTGEITRHNHDAAIVYPRARSRRSQSAPKPYVLVVLTRGISDQAESSRLIARLASIIHSDLAP